MQPQAYKLPRGKEIAGCMLQAAKTLKANSAAGRTSTTPRQASSRQEGRIVV